MLTEQSSMLKKQAGQHEAMEVKLLGLAKIYGSPDLQR